jgi:hypothetical protein
MSITDRRPELAEAYNRGRLIDDLRGGTYTMRLRGELYVPKGAVESNDEYTARLKLGYCHPLYTRTVGFLTGEVFKQKIKIDEAEAEESATSAEINTKLQNWMADVDGCGNELSVFMADTFVDAIDHGMCAVLSDYPAIGNGVRVVDDVKKSGTKPYLIRIPQKDILGYRFEETEEGRKLVYFRYTETVVVKQGTIDTKDETEVRVRVYTPGLCQIYDKSEKLLEEIPTTMQDIPVVFYVLGEPIAKGYPAAKPCMGELAELNRRHWQAATDQAYLMSYVRRPAWFGRGLRDDDKSVVFGPGSMIHTTNTSGDLKNVAVDSGAVAAGKSELDDLEMRAALYGLQAMAPKTGNVTATQIALSTVEASSDLHKWAYAFKDSLNNTMIIVCEMLGISDLPEMMLNTEFHPLAMFSPDVLINAATAGIFSKRLVFQEFKRRGLMGGSETWEDVVSQISEQTTMGGPTGFGSPLSTFLNRNAAR